ncbi:hypothetical protein AYO21_00565 [Fonsecaea monophora]|uniref:DUF2237 domain-containing protein n=1 Tax=Fonsecaea monophora TaxID=254056 RepID=A0A177FLX7_9EURO|nr:hypothetical protein AYO21_00565 [Fonsecaea monophora]KAH0840785.1 hypothetical protein FOPE_06010 [Fonsecaea pedrosoi]OAG45217.1 hypothetical protein AYO21_00565 [Fonsecaea monophora]
MAASPQTSSKEMMKNKNVAGGQLAMHSRDPPTGFFRDGYCRTGPEDKGNHSVAATVNQEFLDFTNSRGNNLGDAGVKDGMKWCLCAHRWKEAFDAAQKGQISQSTVPRVHLHASHESALNTVKYADLSKYAMGGEAPKESTRNRQGAHSDPEQPSHGIARETTELSGKSQPERVGG